MASTHDHSRLVNDVLAHIGSMPNVRIWRNSTGVGRALNDPKSIVSYGLKGSPDIIGFFQGGTFIGIECKTGQAVQSKEQIAFERVSKKFGAHYFLVNNVQQAVELVTKAATAMQAGGK
jgi:hypothetical protein